MDVACVFSKKTSFDKKKLLFQRIETGLRGVYSMTLETSKTLGGVGALLMLISPLSGFAAGAFGNVLGLVGIILVLIAMKGLADHYNESGIFNNTLYGVILTIIGAAVFVAVIVGGAVGLLADLNLDLTTLSTDPAAFSAVDWQAITDFDVIWDYLLVVLGALVVLFVFVLIAALFYRKSLNSLSAKTGVGLFGTTGLIILIGAVLTIIGVGFLLLWVAMLLLTIAFFSIKTETVTTEAT
jgi:uncharacterized membrane protein